MNLSEFFRRVITMHFRKNTLGTLNHARMSHGVILVEYRFWVIGGWGKLKTESCIIVNDRFTCYDQQSELDNYKFYPILFAVPNDFIDCN